MEEATMRIDGRGRPLGAAICAALLLALGIGMVGAQPAGAAEIEYTMLFEDPGAVPAEDFSLEQHAIGLINATPAGERLTFAFRDFNRKNIADALIAARVRGVEIDGVIDGGERNKANVKYLVNNLAGDAVLCGAPVFALHSCIAIGHPVYSPKSLQHNKFMTFSRLADGRRHVVLQTSMNFQYPAQYTLYNDMVEIVGDVGLYDAYVQYAMDLKAQVRADDHYLIAPGSGPNTMFPSPRPQPDLDTDDTVVDRMNEIDCSVGGSRSGRGLIRVAMLPFNTERAAIMRKLIALEDTGCDIEIALTRADGDILAGLVAERIRVHPFFARELGVRPRVNIHDKFWLVDAGSTLTGERTKIAYVGTSNWRADEQYSDDMLLRIVDDGVHAAYSDYWRLIRDRAVSDQERPVSDAVAPAAAIGARPNANAWGWNTRPVTVRVAASDGHDADAVGLERLHIELTGAQTGSWDILGETDGYSVDELKVSEEGTTTVSAYAVDMSGNVGATASRVVRIDKTPPHAWGLGGTAAAW
jgi:hypothetical protein